jgi:hypothetical protein
VDKYYTGFRVSSFSFIFGSALGLWENFVGVSYDGLSQPVLQWVPSTWGVLWLRWVFLSVGILLFTWACFLAVDLLFYLRRFICAWAFVICIGSLFISVGFLLLLGVFIHRGHPFLLRVFFLHPGRLIYCRASPHVAHVLIYGWVVVFVAWVVVLDCSLPYSSKIVFCYIPSLVI